MSRTYANAYDVLPHELVAEIRKHYIGQIWIPKRDRLRVESRRRLIFDLAHKGVPFREIAKLAKISERWVRMIIHTKNKQLGALEKSTASPGASSVGSK